MKPTEVELLEDARELIGTALADELGVPAPPDRTIAKQLSIIMDHIDRLIEDIKRRDRDVK